MAPDTTVTRKSPNRYSLIVLGIAAALVILIPVATYMVTSILNESAIRYNPVYITPDKSDLCPGEYLNYTIEFEVLHRGIVQVVESWCENTDAGTCFVHLTEEYKLPGSNKQVLNAAASVLVPNSASLIPGQCYNLVHDVENGSISEYIVGPVCIRLNCTAPTTEK